MSKHIMVVNVVNKAYIFCGDRNSFLWCIAKSSYALCLHVIL